VQVDNSCAGSGGTAATALDTGADVAGELRRRAQLTSRQAPVIRGSLRDGAGNPVGDATVCVYQTTDLPDASRELATTVTTQANGRFATRLDAGPSRTVDVVYRHNTRKLTDRVDLKSKVVPTLLLPNKQVANGHSVVFQGDIPGPNAEGRAVVLQARVGRKWRTFKQLRTEADGKFKGRYRFTQTVGRVRYVFRALVKSQGGYPYDPGASKKRRVTVNG
jgi:5-hydroxyisourate hydrolase-like protein (transthyretin family)